MFTTQESAITGCFEITPKKFFDNRGGFVKVYHSSLFSDLGIKDNFVEEYYSKSHKNVIRGMHFQLPPHEHAKIVYCISGSALDVVMDLRKNSDTFGKVVTFEINEKNANMIYIPKGLAHGFCVLSDSATLVYKTSTVYNEKCDHGILWSSIDFSWPSSNPIISERDSKLTPYKEFTSPFIL